MPTLSWQINYSSTFASFFIVMTHNSPVNFNLKHFLLWVKGSHENPNFQNFECSGENLPNSSWQLLKAQVSFLWNFASISSAIKHKSLQIFEIFECSCENSSSSSCQFWTDESTPLQILHHSSLSWHISNLYSLSSYIFYVGQKGPIKVPISRLLSALMKIFQISLMSFSKPEVSFSSNFALLFSVMKDNSFLLF